MSISGIPSSNFFSAGIQKQIQQEFQQLGQDLQSGNLSAAQADFVTLQKNVPQSTATSSSQSNNPIAQAFNQLSQDLQSGDLTSAQQDYSTIQSDMQNQTSQVHHPHHHHHSGNGQENSVAQTFSQLGQTLQSGNLSAAQQAYSTLQQDFQQFAQSNGLSTTPSASSLSNSSGVSVTA
jgi:hypothetical protein